MINSISTASNQAPLKIGIVIYPDAEVLDFAGPFEVLTTAVRVHRLPWQVLLVAETNQALKARAGFTVTPDTAFEHCPALDILIVVGGDHTQQMENPVMLNWLKQQADKVSIVASVCTGTFLLAGAGVIDNHSVTTHWEDIPLLKQAFPALDVKSSVRVVKHHNYYSTGGISSGIDMTLTLVAHLTTVELAERTALQMEYRWDRHCYEV